MLAAMSRIFGEVRKNGYVVRDIEAALRHWTERLGVGPFFYFERVPMENFRYHGRAWDGKDPVRTAPPPRAAG